MHEWTKISYIILRWWHLILQIFVYNLYFMLQMGENKMDISNLNLNLGRKVFILIRDIPILDCHWCRIRLFPSLTSCFILTISLLMLAAACAQPHGSGLFMRHLHAPSTANCQLYKMIKHNVNLPLFCWTNKQTKLQAVKQIWIVTCSQHYKSKLNLVTAEST